MSFSRHLRDAKEWMKQKSKSKPFQWTIAIGQGLSLGSSLHDALTKVLTLSTLAGVASRILANVNYGVAGLVTFIMSYMTYSYVHTNLTTSDSTADRLHDHDEQHFTHDKRFLNQQKASIELIEILRSGNLQSAEVQAQLKTLLDTTIDNYVAFQDHIKHRQNLQPVQPNNQPQSISIATGSGESDEKYHPLTDVSISIPTSPRSPTQPSRQGSNTDRFFTLAPHSPIFAFPKMNTAITGTPPIQLFGHRPRNESPGSVKGDKLPLDNPPLLLCPRQAAGNKFELQGITVVANNQDEEHKDIHVEASSLHRFSM